MPRKKWTRNKKGCGSGRTGNSPRPRTVHKSKPRARPIGSGRESPIQIGTSFSDQKHLLESRLEENFYRKWCKSYDLVPTAQYRFHPTRQWRFDFAWPSLKIAVEIQGFGEGHTSYEGMAADYEKHNAAIQHGWKIYYLMGYQLEAKTIIKTLAFIHSCLLGKTTYEVPKRESEWSNKIAEGRRRLNPGTN